MRTNAALSNLILVAVLMLSLALTSACQAAEAKGPKYDIVLPGSELLDPATVRPHTVRYERPGGFMVYKMERTMRRGKDVARLHVYFNTDEGTPDEMVFDPETLGFVGRRMEAKDYVIDMTFDDGRLTGELTPTEGSTYEPREYDQEHPHGGFEPAMMNYWIAALPLAEGYRASLPLFDLSNLPNLSWANIEVLGKESLTLDGKEYSAWKVRSTNGKRVKTVWVSREVPYALKMTMKGSLGAWVPKSSDG